MRRSYHLLFMLSAAGSMLIAGCQENQVSGMLAGDPATGESFAGKNNTDGRQRNYRFHTGTVRI